MANQVKVQGASQSQRQKISEFTRYPHPNLDRIDFEKIKNQDWDGYISLYRGGSFPRGLLQDVLIGLWANGIKPILDYSDDQTIAGPMVQYQFNFDLTDYQNIARQTAIIARTGNICMPPGTGKTITALSIIASTRKTAVIFVHKKELLYQWADEIQNRLGVVAGIVGDDKIQLALPITVAMVQTAMKLPQSLFSDYGMHIWDECHHASAKTWYPTALKSKAMFRFGLSATPFREDGHDLKLRAVMGERIINWGYSQMIEDGWLSRPTIHLMNVGVGAIKGDYHKIYNAWVVANPTRNGLIKTAVESLGGNTYIHVKILDHGRRLQKMIPGSVFISGRDKMEHRKQTIKDFSAGEIPVLISTLLGEGVNIPSITNVVLATPYKSLVATQQVVGRALRLTRDRKCNVVDFIDSVKYLHDHYLRRKEWYDSEKAFEVKLWV